MLVEVLNLTYHSPITIKKITYAGVARRDAVRFGMRHRTSKTSGSCRPARRLPSSQRRLPEPQRIANDGDRAERHGRARDHRAEQHAEPRVQDARGDGDAGHVVDKREE